jgi:hypothetical protein
MRGAPARSIQELAGHRDLSMTQRFMHLSPSALTGAIGLLEAWNAPVSVETMWRRLTPDREVIDCRESCW